MNWTGIRWGASAAIVASLTAGCAARMAAVSTQRTAYVVRAGLLGSDIFYCEAQEDADPQPVCSKVEEVK